MDAEWAAFIFRNTLDLISSAYEDAVKECEKEPSEYNKGRVFGMWEILDTVQNQADIAFSEENEEENP